MADQFHDERRRRLRRRVRGRPHPQSLPALQREDQVRGGARPGGRARLRRGGHRPPRPARRRRPAAPQRRRRQGPVVRAGRADPRPARPGDLPARRLDQGAGPRGGGRARPGGGRQARLARHLLHRRRRHPRLPRAAARARRPATSSTPRPGPELGTHNGAFAYTVGQRKGLDLRVPAADGRPRYVLSITPKTNTVTVGPREELAVDVVTATRPIWHGRSRRPVECDVQLRAHGEVVPAVVTLADGTLDRRAAHAGPRGRRRAGDRGLPPRPGRATSCSARPPSSPVPRRRQCPRQRTGTSPPGATGE